MKIAYLITYFHPLKGGAEDNFYNLAKIAVESGHEVIVYTSDRKAGRTFSAEENIGPGILIKRFNPILRFRMYFVFYPKMLFAIFRDKPDVIHASGFGFVWHDLMLMIIKLLRRKTVLVNTPHGPMVIYENTAFIEKFIKTFTRTFEKLTINKLYSTVIAVNPNQGVWMKEYGIPETKIRFVPNGISEETLNRIKSITVRQIEEFKQKHDLQNKLVISNVGRFSYYKGVDHIVEALSNIKNIEKVRLCIVGRDDGFLNEINTIIKKYNLEKNVLVFENASEEIRNIILKTSEIFILASEWEAFGIVFLEALAADNAIITTHTEGSDFLFRNNETAMFYNYGDIQSLTTILSDLIDNSEQRNRLAEKARYIPSDFMWHKIGQEYLKILQKLI